METLKAALEQPRFWSAVHAAEYLTELGLAQDSVRSFLSRQGTCEAEPVKRIGIWRVKAQLFRAEGKQDEFDRVISSLKGIAFAEKEVPDQVHALETLFKLRYRCDLAEQAQLCKICDDAKVPPLLRIYSRALLALVKPEALSGFAGLFQAYKDKEPDCTALLYVLQAYSSIPEELALALKAYLRASKSDAKRIGAMRILLKCGQLQFSQLDMELPPTGESLRLLLDYAPKSKGCRRMIALLKKTDSLEARLLAAYATLRLQPKNG